METEHIDYINRFNDKVKSNTVLYTRETHKQKDSAKLKLRNKLVISKLVSLFSQKTFGLI